MLLYYINSSWRDISDQSSCEAITSPPYQLELFTLGRPPHTCSRPAACCETLRTLSSCRWDQPSQRLRQCGLIWARSQVCSHTIIIKTCAILLIFLFSTHKLFERSTFLQQAVSYHAKAIGDINQANSWLQNINALWTNISGKERKRILHDCAKIIIAHLIACFTIACIASGALIILFMFCR